MNDQEYCPDDRYCVTCGEELPSNPDEDSPAFEGYCDEKCRGISQRRVIARGRCDNRYEND